MSDEETKITLLLSEIKEDPRFLRATSNSIRATSARVPNDPLLDSLNYTSPLISSVSDNTPGIFDVRLDLFQLLRVFPDVDRIKIQDFLQDSMSKSLSTLTQIDEFVTRVSHIGGLQDTIELDDFPRYTLDKHPIDILEVVSSIEDDFKIGKKVLDIINAEDPVSNFFEKSALRRSKYFRLRLDPQSLLSLAEELARPGLLHPSGNKVIAVNPLRKLYASGIVSNISGWGTIVSDSRYAGTDFSGTGTKKSVSFNGTDPNNSNGGDYVSLTWGGPYANQGQMPTEEPIYATGAAGFYTKARFFNSTTYEFLWPTWTTYPVYHNLETGRKGMLLPRGGPNETESKFISSDGNVIDRLVFWWEPGYEDQYTGFKADEKNSGNLIVTHPSRLSGSSSGTGLGEMSDLKSVTFLPHPDGTSTVNFTGYYEETIEGPFGPTTEITEPGTLAQIEDFIFEMKKRSSVKANELVKVLDLILPAKARVAFEQINTTSISKNKIVLEGEESTFLPDDLVDPKWYPHKRVFDNIELEQLFLNPKAQTQFDRLKSNIDVSKHSDIQPILEVYKVLAPLFNKEVTKDLLDKVHTQDLILSPREQIQFDLLSTLIKVEKLRTKGFDFKLKLANEFQEIDFIKSLIEDVDTVSDLVVAGKALQLVERIQAKEEPKKKTAEFPEDLFELTDSSNYLFDKGVFFDIEKIRELTLVGRDLELLEKISFLFEERKKSSRIETEIVEALSTVRAKKFDILRDGEDFFKVIAPLITTPAISRIKTTKIKLKDFLKFDPDFTVESINIFGNADFHQLFTSLFDIHENVDVQERLLYKAKAPKVQFDVSKIEAERDTLSPNKGVISDVKKIDDTFDPFLFRKNAQESKGNYKSKPLFRGQAQTIFDILKLTQDLSHIDFVKAAISDVKKIDDTVHPLFLNRGVQEEELFLQNFILRPLAELINNQLKMEDLDFSSVPSKAIENKTSLSDFQSLHHERKRVFDDRFSLSIKGSAFVRDEEYVTGAYFLEPYVATIPPGRSRQF